MIHRARTIIRYTPPKRSKPQNVFLYLAFGCLAGITPFGIALALELLT